MTSEPDGKPGRRPPTIELKATEVGNPGSAARSAEQTPAGERPAKSDAPAQDTSGPQAPGPQPSRDTAGRFKTLAVSAAFGALAMAAIIAGLWIAGFVPRHEAAAPAATATSIVSPSAGPDIAARLDKIETTIEAQRPESALANRVAEAQAQTKSLGDSLAVLSRRVDDIAGTSQSAAKQADAAQAAAEAAKSAIETTSQTAVQKSEMDALASRIAALENTVKALSADAAHPAPGAVDRAARLTAAAEALRAAVERGAPYRAELAAVQSLGVEPNAITPLAPFAATGVPSADALAHELANLAAALPRASDTTPGAATFLGRLEANAQQLVRITPVDAPVSNDPSAVIARLKLDAARTDIAAALTDIAALPDAANPLAADWVNKVEAREAAIAAARQIAAAALAALAKPAAQ